MTSNMGHLLWSGIVAEERADAVVRQLMSDAMFSGWGVRTLSTDDRGYNPIGYHLGTVWPHDNSLIAMGLARYGYREEANRIATGADRRGRATPVTGCRRRSRATPGRCRGSRCRTRPRAARRRGPPRRRCCSCARCSAWRRGTGAHGRPGAAGGDRPHRHQGHQRLRWPVDDRGGRHVWIGVQGSRLPVGFALTSVRSGRPPRTGRRLGFAMGLRRRSAG